MYNLAIRKCTSPNPEIENFQMKICYPAGDWTPDLLNPGADKLTIWASAASLTEDVEASLNNKEKVEFILVKDINV